MIYEIDISTAVLNNSPVIRNRNNIFILDVVVVNQVYDNNISTKTFGIGRPVIPIKSPNVRAFTVSTPREISKSDIMASWCKEYFHQYRFAPLERKKKCTPGLEIDRYRSFPFIQSFALPCFCWVYVREAPPCLSTQSLQSSSSVSSN